jgi:hypothetical protein
MRFTKLSLGWACAFFLSTSRAPCAHAQDRDPVTSLSERPRAPGPANLDIPTVGDPIFLGEIDSPGTELRDAVIHSGHASPDNEIALSPGQTLTFRTSFPPGVVQGVEDLQFSGSPPWLVTTTQRPLTSATPDRPQIWEFSVTLSPDAKGDIPLAVHMIVPLHGDNGAWNWGMMVRPTPALAKAPISPETTTETEAREAPAPEPTARRTALGWFADGVYAATVGPLETLFRAIVHAVVSRTEGRASERAAADSRPAADGNANGLPDDLAKAVRHRDAAEQASPTAGLSRVLEERIVEEAHADRPSGE